MTVQDASLEEIRNEIDAIDDGLVDLIAKRIAASLKVRDRKSTSGSLAVSPIRPGREAMILRRLLARSKGSVPPETLVRLWRVILSSSTLAQADVALHVPQELAASVPVQRMLLEHFGPMRVMAHDDVAHVLALAGTAPGDLCVVNTASAWADPFMQGIAGSARVVGVLPAVKSAERPAYLALGHATAQQTGDDQTLIISRGPLSGRTLPAPVWEARSGAFVLTSLPGFLSERDDVLQQLKNAHPTLELRVAGQFPGPIEV